MKLTRRESVQRRHGRIRRSIVGTPERPRLSIFRSNQHIYAQVIDDTKHSTLAAASTLDPELRKGLTESGANTCQASAEVGKLIAQRSLDKGVNQVVFDRGGNLYHGRIQALAEAAREAGLDF